MKLIGFAVRSSVHARYARMASGSRQTTQTVAFSATRFRRLNGLIELLEIHARVERRDLVGVAVEHEGLATAELADPPLGRLAPARMADLGVDVRVEPVFRRCRHVPGGLRLVGHEADPDEGLGALEAILPRD